MLITFANQKGGTGKSTLTLLYALYLEMHFKSRVCILDMDGQNSLSQKALKDGPKQDAFSYHLMPADLQDLPIAQSELKEGQYDYVLIDLPSGPSWEDLVTVYQAAELVICPYQADELTLSGTTVFLNVLKNINSDAALLFVPNKVKRNASEQLEAAVKAVLSRHGTVTEAIADRPEFSRLDTTNEKMMDLARAALGAIHQKCIEYRQARSSSGSSAHGPL